jgi:hypothetical protein
MPAREWLASYDRTWLRGDVVAGVTLAAYLLPSAIGDAGAARGALIDSAAGRVESPAVQGALPGGPTGQHQSFPPMQTVHEA